MWLYLYVGFCEVIKIKWGVFGLRWWHRKLQTQLLPQIHWIYIFSWSNSLRKKSRNQLSSNTHLVNEKILRAKCVGKAETHSHHKPHPCHRDTQWAAGSHNSYPGGIKALDQISSTLTFKTSTWGTEHQNIQHGKTTGLASLRSSDYRQETNSF